MKPGRPVTAVAAGELWHGATLRGLAQGFRNVGWIVNEVEASPSITGKRTFLDRAAGRITHGIEVREYNRRILDAAEQSGADFLLTVKGAYISANTLRGLRARDTRSVNVYPDVSFDHPGVSLNGVTAHDFVVTTKEYHLSTLATKMAADRFKLVHHGYSPLVHRPIGMVETYEYDIVYVGNASPSKLDWLVAVRTAHPDRSMLIVGSGWRELAAGTVVEPDVLGRALTGDGCAWAYSAGKINLALHWGPPRPGASEDSVSTRTFEIPACGGFMLHIDNPEVRTLFDVGTEIDVFDNPDTLNRQISRYLADDGLRQRMAEAARRRAVPNYSLDARAAEIARFVTASSGRGGQAAI